MVLLGYDLGSSSIKAALVDENGDEIAVVQYPDTELQINAPQPGWAEQDPNDWWSNICDATRKLLGQTDIDPGEVKSIGISYQMHGLVAVDAQQKSLRPSIIWCDSRAVEIGQNAFEGIGEEKCLDTLLNPVGNFTASKLKWVKENEPDVYDRIDKIMLPGDFVAMKMTGKASTTISGLSEGMLWDFKNNRVSAEVMDYFGFDQNMIPEIIGTFENSGTLTDEAAEQLGLSGGIPVTYRAGDQPNNAMSLGALAPGEMAATGGTSGVVYCVTDKIATDPKGRINAFAHVNHRSTDPRIGLLLCINGAGIQYSWLRTILGDRAISYDELESRAKTVPVGSDGLHVLPFGNGVERMLESRNQGADFMHLDFNRHSQNHLYRAGLEGVAFSFIHGMRIFEELGVALGTVRVGNDNLFQSEIFSSTISTVLDVQIEMYETTGAIGAARASGVAMGIFPSPEVAFQRKNPVKIFSPEKDQNSYRNAYHSWENSFSKTYN